jgi:hypothetical protein
MECRFRGKLSHVFWTRIKRGTNTQPCLMTIVDEKISPINIDMIIASKNITNPITIEALRSVALTIEDLTSNFGDASIFSSENLIIKNKPRLKNQMDKSNIIYSKRKA